MLTGSAIARVSCLLVAIGGGLPIAGQTPDAVTQPLPTEVPHEMVVVPAKGAMLDGVNAGKPNASAIVWTFATVPRKGFDTLRMVISPRQLVARNNFVYWAYQNWFMNGAAFYFGLQPNGYFRNGGVGKMALFSVFGAGSSSKDGDCFASADGGAGTSCHLHYDWQPGERYEFTVALVAQDARTMTWEGSVYDLDRGKGKVIGRIQVTRDHGYLKPFGGVSFIEHFRQDLSCVQQPGSEVLFFAPRGYRDERESVGTARSLDVNSGCNTRFFGDGDGYVYVDAGTGRLR
jgi:hypothetical protein